MKLVAFGYKKGSGKDTSAKFLTTALKLNCQGVKIKRISFAGVLKDVCEQMFGWTGLRCGQFYEQNRMFKEECLTRVGLTPREIWIKVGNSMRDIHQDVWVECALQNSEHDFGIITDLRFLNEVVAIRKRGGMVIRVDRDGLEKGTDAAEVDLDRFDSWDSVVNNNGSMEFLNNQMVELASALCQKG